MNPHVQLVPHLPPEGQVPTGAGKIPPPAPLDPSNQNYQIMTAVNLANRVPNQLSLDDDDDKESIGPESDISNTCNIKPQVSSHLSDGKVLLDPVQDHVKQQLQLTA